MKLTQNPSKMPGGRVMDWFLGLYFKNWDNYLNNVIKMNWEKDWDTLIIRLIMCRFLDLICDVTAINLIH